MMILVITIIGLVNAKIYTVYQRPLVSLLGLWELSLNPIIYYYGLLVTNYI